MGYAEEVFQQIKSFIERQGWEFSDKDEGQSKRFDVRYGKFNCAVKVYSNGTIQVQGSPSNLKESLDQLKLAIEQDGSLAIDILPFEIEAFPDKLLKNIPSVNPIIVRFLRESIQCFKAGSLLGASFLLGAASEKAIWLLIDSFTSAIDDDANQKRFREGLNNKFVSRAYEEFMKSSNPVSPNRLIQHSSTILKPKSNRSSGFFGSVAMK